MSILVDFIMVSDFAVTPVSSSCILGDNKLPQVTLSLIGNAEIRGISEVIILFCGISLTLDLQQIQVDLLYFFLTFDKICIMKMNIVTVTESTKPRTHAAIWQ